MSAGIAPAWPAETHRVGVPAVTRGERHGRGMRRLYSLSCIAVKLPSRKTKCPWIASGNFSCLPLGNAEQGCSETPLRGNPTRLVGFAAAQQRVNPCRGRAAPRRRASNRGNP